MGHPLRKFLDDEEEDTMRRMDKKKLNRLTNNLSSLYHLEGNINETRKNELCAITDKSSNCLGRKSSLHNNSDSFTQTMYDITSMQLQSNRRYATNPQYIATTTNTATTTTTILYDKLTRPSMAFVIVALTLSSCIFTIQTQAFSSTNGDAVSPPSLLPNQQDGKESNLNDRQDLMANSEPGALSSSVASSSSSQSSIVASLSSAVATAAAAAAVAAAQNSLSGSDARSLLSGSSSSSSTGPSSSLNNHNHRTHHRSPGVHLAIKLADAIPEVPYSILHNMKKVDHAAPFYNVPNKLTSSGTSKESAHGLLASALSASGGFSGAADQLSSLFRSPLWKRIADGYGEFTSEFRSLFRAPPTTMKGPMSPTTKLIRDISLPALVMLLASTIPSDWRPVRTRRKSLASTDLSQLSTPHDPMIASASELSNFPSVLSRQQQLLMPNLNVALQQNTGEFNRPTVTQLYNQFDTQQSQTASNQLARVGDINLQVASGTGPAAAAYAGNGANLILAHPLTSQNHLEATTEQQPIRRVGDHFSGLADSIPADSTNTKHQQQHIKPVKARSHSEVITSNQPTSLFSSLTSSSIPNVGQSELMNRIMNANGNSNQVNSYRMMSLADELKMIPSLVWGRDQLNDKHRYSLLGSDNDNELVANNFGNLQNEQQQKLSPSSKPFLLSAMTHALSTVLNSPPESGFDSSSGSSIQKVKQTFITLNGNNNNNENHNIIGDKTINHRDSLLQRRQQQSGVEQRELTQFLPQSWREAVKRTMNNVQQQATTQWKSIEGQLTNWVQDKLKTLPTPSSASSGQNGPIGTASAPVANIIASVSSTAMNILGLGSKNSNSSSSSQIQSAVSSGSSFDSSSNLVASTTAIESTVGQGGKNESPNRALQPAKAALAGVANMIVNTLTNRQITPSHHSSSPASSLNSRSPSGSESSKTSLVSQYPTQTGSQPIESHPSSSVISSSMASSTASTSGSLSSLVTA